MSVEYFWSEGMQHSIGKSVRISEKPRYKSSLPYAGKSGEIVAYRAGQDYGDGIVENPEFTIIFEQKTKAARINAYDVEII